MLDNAYDDAQCAVKFYLFLRDDGCLFLYSQVFKYFQYLNTSGQYLNTGTVLVFK